MKKKIKPGEMEKKINGKPIDKSQKKLFVVVRKRFIREIYPCIQAT